MRELTEEQMEARRVAGAHVFDEVWEGELHVAPDPSIPHQRLEASLLVWMRTRWMSGGARECLARTNVARPGLEDWRSDHRIPDLVAWTDSSGHVARGAHLEGAPEVCVEIRSPDDASYSKLATYLDWGAREVWIIDRDTCAVEIYVRGDAELVERRGYEAGGWVTSAFGIRMRGHDGGLEIELVQDPSTRARLP